MKKQMLLLSATILFATVSFAQTFTINPRTVNDTVPCTGLTQFMVGVTNNGSTDLLLSYSLISNTLPDTACWTQVVCDCNVCHPDNHIPVTDNCFSKITPASTNGAFFIYDVKDAQNHYGSGTLKYLIYETSNTTNRDTLTFNISGCANGAACTVGINDIDLSALTIYPSLATDKFYIKNDNHISSLDNIKIYDMLGKTIYSEKSVEMGHSKKEINVASFPAGIYFIELNKGAFSTTRKFVKVN